LDELFKDPSSEYRGAPFWAWNCKLDKQEMTRQVGYFKEMGLGGFHMHCRTGLATDYMGEEYLDIIKSCVEKAKSEEMLAWLYDEDRWPSGFGGGLVTKDDAFKSRYLVFTPIDQDTRTDNSQLLVSGMKTVSHGRGVLLARYDVTLENGYLKSYRRLKDGESGQNIWYAYREISLPSPWFNNQTYVDTMNKKAIERFIEVTHEKYYAKLKEHFGKTIPAIFTDEPQFARKHNLGYAESKAEAILAYTDDFPATYQKQYGADFFETLPEIFWDLPGHQASVARYRYHDHASERFAAAFADTLGKWCDEHGIKLTGHMMEEPTLDSQTRAIGDCMRSYRGFTLPGIDMLCDRREYSTAKQAQSASHQYGRSGVTSELYGVTNWDFDFRGHKLQGDWQAALGVTNRVQHLSWASMAGEAKRDYPASIFYQSPWYKEYGYIEDHFARVNVAMTSGKPLVRIGVIHPVESYWLNFGPEEQTSELRSQLDTRFENVIDWLLFGQLDFDFISESLLPSLYKDSANKKFVVGEMAYDTILVPGCLVLRRTTVERLSAFVKKGGRVIFMGEVPGLVDAVPSEEAIALAKQADIIPFDKISLLNATEPFRMVDIRDKAGRRSDRYLTQTRQTGEGQWLFIANGREVKNPDVSEAYPVKITLNQLCSAEIYDTLSGTHQAAAVKQENGKTILEYTLFEHDSLLLKLTPGIAEPAEAEILKISETPEAVFTGSYPVTLSEPNVLLLDQAEYALDGEKYCPKEEVLRIDNLLRTRLHYPLKMEAFAQPWVTKGKKEEIHSLKLRYHIKSGLPVSGAKLAVEDAELLQLSLNGRPVEAEINGWFTDKCIKTVPLPALKAGENILEISMPYHSNSNLEWCYLLGDFGVTVHGSTAELINPVAELSFGDWVSQGLPFYAGNVTYHCPVNLPDGNYVLHAAKYHAPLLKAAVDGRERGALVFAPYSLPLGRLSGSHTVDITAFGSRINAFGAVHNCDGGWSWHGPGAWRSRGDQFSYEYNLKRCGVLAAPKLFMVE